MKKKSRTSHPVLYCSPNRQSRILLYSVIGCESPTRILSDAWSHVLQPTSEGFCKVSFNIFFRKLFRKIFIRDFGKLRHTATYYFNIPTGETRSSKLRVWKTLILFKLMQFCSFSYPASVWKFHRVQQDGRNISVNEKNSGYSLADILSLSLQAVSEGKVVRGVFSKPESFSAP